MVVLVLPFYLDKAIAAVAGAILLTWLGRRPGAALRTLIVVLPFSLLALAWLFKLGVPAQFVRQLAFWKEAMIAAVVVAGVLKARTAGIKADLLDLFCLAYIALGLGYLLMPGFFVDGPGAGIAFGTRLNGFRYDVVYVVLFLAARHARIPAADVVRAATAFCKMAAIVAAISVYEFFFASSWNNFVTRTVGLPTYKFFILNINPRSDPYFYDIRAYTSVAGRDLLRVGGVLVNFQSFAFLLLIAVALLAEMQVRRGQGRSAWIALAFPLVIAGVILTQTRSALLALGVLLALAVLRQPGRLLTARVRMTIVIGALALVAIPVIFAIGLNDRLAGKDDFSSNESHANSTRGGLELMFDRPLGTGLATGAGAGQRATLDEVQYTVSENQFLQIGTQLGIIGLTLWVGVYVTTIAALGRALRRRSGADGATALDRYGSAGEVPPDDADVAAAATVGTGTRMALIGMIPTLIFLQAFTFFEVSWAIWGLAGAALGCLEVAGKHDADARGDTYASRPRSAYV
jgi:hypothetical protein